MKNEKHLSLAEKVEVLKENFDKKNIKYLEWINGKIKDIFGIEGLFYMDYKKFLNTELPKDFYEKMSNVIDYEYNNIKLNESIEDESEE